MYAYIIHSESLILLFVYKSGNNPSQTSRSVYSCRLLLQDNRGRTLRSCVVRLAAENLRALRMELPVTKDVSRGLHINSFINVKSTSSLNISRIVHPFSYHFYSALRSTFSIVNVSSFPHI